ncbi:hypothetical protein LK12_05765 [Novosphingobium malaysiense]|uniref:Pilus assembly protein n=2 Tax=Novosphingobium malaysiense TaxID=1348853 RepID=A0A0B1ZQ43_9SPHN|nr:Flp family type IVb pilin [Novosphingobium malaysiense]KHK92696.1 hypothetical protein LK12_05765 [Novosphingobium malaysiense]
MTKFFKKFAQDESGASAAEYAIILVVVGLAIVVGAQTLSDSISGAMTNTAGCIDNPSNSTC